MCSKRSYTDAERLELATKLDADLEIFINNLPKQQSSEDNEPIEEIMKHPFFMQTTPNVDECVHPLYEGLQRLKYDPEENTPDELGLAYKDDGNFHYKHHNYRTAIVAYSEGIRQMGINQQVHISLLNNRSAAYFLLGNYRKCLTDCQTVIQLQPSHRKCRIRAAKCFYQLQCFQEALKVSNELLLDAEERVTFKEIEILKKNCQTALKKAARDSRKREIQKEKDTEMNASLLAAIQLRKLRLRGVHLLDAPHLPKVHFDTSTKSRLLWPVVFSYPEFSIQDYVQEFHEDNRFIELFSNMFAKCPPWDIRGAYIGGNLSLYFETDSGLVSLDPSNTLGTALQHPKFIIKNGIPMFIIFEKDSIVEKHYLESNI